MLESNNKTITSKSVTNLPTRTVSQVSSEETPKTEEGFMQSANANEVELMTQIGDNFMSSAIMAKSLVMPSYLDLHPKDPAISFRWINFKGGEGRPLFFAKSLGFSNTRPEDIKGVVDFSMVKDNDGGLICGDLILMKIRKADLYGHYKANVIKAQTMAGKDHAHEEALRISREQFRTDVGNKAQGKVAFYRPATVPGEL